jgi:aminoglycoside phosphotransferase (APT) family kinase protein
MPTEESIQALLEILAPNSSGFSIHELSGSYSNHTHLVKIEFADKAPQQIVLRRYNETVGGYEEKAKREYKALELIHQHAVFAPKPLYIDENGQLLGSSGIVTEFVTGKQIEPPTDASKWGQKAKETATMLAQIHAIPYDDAIKPYLMDDTIEGAWFIKSGEIPDYMRADLDGEMVWHMVHDLLPKRHRVKSVFSHTDYWSGNILWHEGEISAVVDWEEAAYGDPAYDVAYCRMEYYLEGLDDAAEEFLRVYQQQTNRPLKNLGLWELAASVRPMTDPSGWFTRPFMEDRFRRFIANAKQRIMS